MLSDMRHSVQVLALGIALLLGAMSADVIGTAYQLLFLLILSLVLAVAGAVVAIRGMFEFLGERI